MCFTTPSLAVEIMGVRLGVVKQSFFGLPGQYDRRVRRANSVPGCSRGCCYGYGHGYFTERRTSAHAHTQEC